MGRLSDKVALVTGASGGIGRATVERFAREGATVIATDVVTPATPFTDAVIAFTTLDVASESGWAALAADVIERHGRIDVLVNNAGIGGDMAPITTAGIESWDRVIAVNLTGPFLGMRAFLPHMQARKSGSVINISSIWGNAAVGFGAAYHATKGGVRQLTKHAAVVCGSDNVRVNSIHPGVVATPPVLDAQDAATTAEILRGGALGRMADPDEIANAILFLASDESEFMTGSEMVVDGGYLAKGS